MCLCFGASEVGVIFLFLRLLVFCVSFYLPHSYTSFISVFCVCYLLYFCLCFVQRHASVYFVQLSALGIKFIQKMRKASSSNNKTYTNEGQKYKIQKKYTTTNDREKPNT